MIKKIPFTSDLIQIGNANFEANELVWSDGKVVYGRTREPQGYAPVVEDNGGFWVGEQSIVDGYYKLVHKNLLLGGKIVSDRHGEIQCFPAYATVSIENWNNCGYVYKKINNAISCYQYTGAIISLDGNGNALIYHDYQLFFTSFGSRKQDINNRDLFIGRIAVSSDTEFLFWGSYYSIDTNTNTTYVYDEDMVQIATYSNGIIHTADYDGAGSIEINDDYPLYDSTKVIVDLSLLRSLDGLNGIWIVDAFSIILAEDAGKIVFKNGLKFVYDSSMNLIANEIGNGIIRFYGQTMQEYTGGIYVENLVDTGSVDGDNDTIYTGDYVIRKACNNTEMVNQQNPKLYKLYNTDEYTDKVRKMFQLATSQDCRITVKNPDRDTNGNVVYLGTYTIRLTIPIVIDTGKIVFKNGYTYVYDNSMNLIAEETNNGILVYDSQGNIIYNGLGVIDYYNLVDTETVDGDGDTIYTGDFVVAKRLSSSPILSGNAEASVDGNNDVTLYDSNDDIIAFENTVNNVTNVTVFEDNNTIYIGEGSISTNMQAVEWNCNYDIRRDVTGSSSKIVSIGGNTYQDQQGKWHIEGGTVQIYNTGALFAEGPGSGSTGTVTIYYVPTSWTGSGWIDTSNLTPQGTDTSGNPVFSGSYTIRRDITGSGLLRIINNNNVIYDSNHDLIAQESGNQVIVYNQQGGIDWQGYGWIDTSNLVITRYYGAYVIHCDIDGITGNDTIIEVDNPTGNNDIYVYSRFDEQQQDIVAYEDESEVIYYYNNTNYRGYGYIEPSNLDARRSIKQYYVNIQNPVLVEQQYPNVLTIDSDISNPIELNLETMELSIDSTVYTSNNLDLYNTKEIVYPAGIHNWKKFLISQDGKKIFKQGNNALVNKVYNGIKDCFSLAWLRNKWK